MASPIFQEMGSLSRCPGRPEVQVARARNAADTMAAVRRLLAQITAKHPDVGILTGKVEKLVVSLVPEAADVRGGRQGREGDRQDGTGGVAGPLTAPVSTAGRPSATRSGTKALSGAELGTVPRCGRTLLAGHVPTLTDVVPTSCFLWKH